MSKILVDTIDTRSGTSNMTIGSSNTSQITLKSGATLTNFPKGLSEVDMWRVTTSFANANNGTSELKSDNWERADTEFSKIGTGLSESSGIFTLPSTGIYLISAIASYYPNGANSGVELQIRFSTGGSYDTRAIALSGAAGADRPESVSCQTIFDVTNVSTHKFAIYTAGTTYSNFWRAASDRQMFGFTCLRLGDT
tara:strand:- start:3574 stop:4161 length:588 start_codon:yes stop_codon:yes gene_type:complete